MDKILCFDNVRRPTKDATPKLLHEMANHFNQIASVDSTGKELQLLTTKAEATAYKAILWKGTPEPTIERIIKRIFPGTKYFSVGGRTIKIEWRGVVWKFKPGDSWKRSTFSSKEYYKRYVLSCRNGTPVTLNLRVPGRTEQYKLKPRPRVNGDCMFPTLNVAPGWRRYHHSCQNY